ncbi:sugar kinase [Spongiactinospora gelatinilytica]|uniref:Sugar kinase n=1 Tax=Spongiactinospora gelatinilytica TaxID=2666298 RepID=A0A2W2G2P9_9ACTN|nr:ROK family transcriptional regulator [Spongiactinospora gelatinilytica]PZG28437.1 sugar kinase [Spongiactinospora gelatinilytica]
MNANPGRPRLLRELNDRAVLELLGSSGILTRAQISEATGLSKVTINHVLARLAERGVIVQTGVQAGGRGPNAALHGLNPASGYVIGLAVDMETTRAILADITGRALAEVTVPTDVAEDPVTAVHDLAGRLTAEAGIALSQVRACVIGVSAVIDPATGDVGFCYDLPAWEPGVLHRLRLRLGVPVSIDNDVNLAAVAERALGAARDVRGFVLVWIGLGPGGAVMVGDQLLRGATGTAGELGWMPVPGAPVSDGVVDRARGGVGAAFQTLVGWQAVQELAGEHGLRADHVRDSVAAAVASPAGAPFLDELARRIALGVASICTVLDPELVVLGSDVGSTGGPALAGRVERAVAGMCLGRPRVVASDVPGGPVVRGALLIGIGQARDRVFFGEDHEVASGAGDQAAGRSRLAKGTP